MLNKYHLLLNKLEAFVVCDHSTWKLYFEGTKLPFSIKYFNPLHQESADFINKIIKMDQMSFGQAAMAMEKWVLFDCAMIPGFVFGFYLKGTDLTANDLAVCEIESSDIYPVSMYIAIPNADKKTWFGHNLCSLNGKIEHDLSGLGLMTKAFALEVFKISCLKGATQWSSHALSLHARFGDLKINSALTPSHSKLETLCYTCEIDNPLGVLSKPKQTDLKTNLFFANSLNGLRTIQELIENGQEFKLKSLDKDFLYLEKVIE